MELLHFIWDHGLGNSLTATADPRKWDDESLEAAFDAAGYSIDRRTIQNWHSGATVPKVENLRALARVVSTNEPARQRWADALIDARSREARARKAEQAEKEPSKLPDAAGGSRFRHPALIGAAIFGIAVSAYAAIEFNRPPQARAVNILFCSEEGFSTETLLCEEPRAEFPGTIRKIYTSFQFENAYAGQPFERRWYRNGRQFKTRDGFNDAAWTGWTFLYNPKTHDPGEYHLRVIIGGNVTTGTFRVRQ